MEMRKTYICSLGFDATSIVRLIGEKGLTANDTIILVTTTHTHPRAETAIKSLKDFAEKLNPKSTIDVIRIPETSLEESLPVLVQRIRQEKSRGSNIIVDISGGPKNIAVALYLAAALAPADEVHLTSEVTGERVHLPLIPIHLLLTPRQLKVLSMLPATLTELSQKLQVSKPAVSRLMARMKEKGLVTMNKNRYEPTPWGRILLYTQHHPEAAKEDRPPIN
ncbi:hypothetical protein MA03_02915 [Infirmifilum uzonense]|uniref:CRISPR locus-related DNA-binding protein n=2 Tax=Infirmifilum uzonense TaxID=1550241 RepID=A0A0F7FH38_9CREN|nr:hypothetical protein MA03_02915 [Infirmifilum uzonense]